MQHQYRVLCVASHPAQYSAPNFRRMAQHSQLDILVAYCSMQGAERAVDPEFGVEVAWDIPLLDGYPWLHVPNRTPQPETQGFWRLVNPDLAYLIRTRRFDAVILYTGYTVASFWIAVAAAKSCGAAVLFGTDAHTLAPRDAKAWKRWVKAWLWPPLFRLADTVIVPSSGGVQLMQAIRVPDNRIFLTPYVVNNAWWLQQAEQVDHAAVRATWNIPPDDVVVLFCAKLQPWKRPQDVLRAFAQAQVPQSWLVYAGDGPLRTELEQMAHELHIADRVLFLGFVNQTQLPAIYVASDVLVFPSEHEPFGVVVNEMMLCGHSVIVSDQVGARYDLVEPGQTGFIYPARDMDALARLLNELLPNRERLRRMGSLAYERVQDWSPERNVAALVQAVERAVTLKRGAQTL
jgi:glycosyltransferase involved in cell wall biosynthesis